MQNLIIDSRIRKEEYDYLSKYFNVIKLELSEDVYEEISGHSDIFYCKVNNKVISSPNAKYESEEFLKGNLEVKNKYPDVIIFYRLGDLYPDDVMYNVCQIGNKLIVNKYVDKKIIEFWKTQNEEDNIITVNQGYTKCSISVTGDNSCITSDVGIYKKLIEENINVSLIEENRIFLLDKKSNLSKMNGFIGGATFVFNNKFVLFGDFRKLKRSNQEIIKENLRNNKLELIDFKNLELIDYGGAIIY